MKNTVIFIQFSESIQVTNIIQFHYSYHLITRLNHYYDHINAVKQMSCFLGYLPNYFYGIPKNHKN